MLAWSQLLPGRLLHWITGDSLEPGFMFPKLHSHISTVQSEPPYMPEKPGYVLGMDMWSGTPSAVKSKATPGAMP